MGSFLAETTLRWRAKYFVDIDASLNAPLQMVHGEALAGGARADRMFSKGAVTKFRWINVCFSL